MVANPLVVAVCVVVHGEFGSSDFRVLLQKRARGDYVGYWCLPGGKVDPNEHISSGAIREIIEETGLECSFVSHVGVVSEKLIEKFESVVDDKVESSEALVTSFASHKVLQLNLHLCELSAPHLNFEAHLDEGELKWVTLDQFEEMKEQIIPSDYLMFTKMFLAKQRGEASFQSYFECEILKKGEEHTLVLFE